MVSDKGFPPLRLRVEQAGPLCPESEGPGSLGSSSCIYSGESGSAALAGAEDADGVNKEEERILLQGFLSP